MADTFSMLKTEFAARGYDYLDDTRQGRYLNRAYQIICDEADWPFLEKELTAQTAPVTISDLGRVLYVADATQGTELYGDDQRTVSIADPARLNVGNANTWYITGGDTLNVYPADTAASLTIRYIRVPAELSGASDEPLIPQPYRNLITDGAVYLALKDNDEWDAALAAKQFFDYEVGRMVTRLMVKNAQNPDSIVASSTYPYPY